VFFDVSVEPSTIAEEHGFGDENSNSDASGVQEEDKLGTTSTGVHQPSSRISDEQLLDEKGGLTGLSPREESTNGTRLPQLRKNTRTPTRVLSFSAEDSSSLNKDVLHETNVFQPPDHKRLRKLLKKYP
jgi:hypothetical protein